jgi:Domain of unknown function (DUF4349)
MSQPDLLTQLQESRPIAPAELRERIARLAAEASPPPRRPVSRRRLFTVLVPVTAAAVVVGAVALTRGGAPRQAAFVEHAPPPVAAATAGAAATDTAVQPPALQKSSAPAAKGLTTVSPSRTRVQDYSASLQLRLANPKAVSDASEQAVRIATSLGGYQSSVNVSAGGNSGYADLVLRIPVTRVRVAISRLSALGTIIGENVSIRDRQTQVDAATRKITRLKALLAGWQAQSQTTETQQHIAALTTQIGRLQRARAATVRTASYATVHLELTTRTPVAPVHQGHGPLHQLGVIFRWAGIGAVYGLALGAPVAVLLGLGWLIARTIRRRRDERLLASS